MEENKGGMAMRNILALGMIPLMAAAAAAQDQQVGARTKAMGGSYTAVEDDPVSVWLNPGGIATQTDALAVAYQTYTSWDIKIGSAVLAGPDPQVEANHSWN